MVHVAELAPFRVIGAAARRAVEKVSVGMIVDGFRVTDQLVTCGRFGQFTDLDVNDIAQHHTTAKLKLQIGCMRLLR